MVDDVQRRQGHGKLYGRPLDENGAIEFSTRTATAVAAQRERDALLIEALLVEERYNYEGDIEALLTQLIERLPAAIRAQCDGDGHNWQQPEGFRWPVCRTCGVVQRADKQNKPCNGLTKMREMETISRAVRLLQIAGTQLESRHPARRPMEEAVKVLAASRAQRDGD